MKYNNTIIEKALNNLISIEKDGLSLIILKSFKEYIDNGNKISKLTWFKDIKGFIEYAESH